MKSALRPLLYPKIGWLFLVLLLGLDQVTWSVSFGDGSSTKVAATDSEAKSAKATKSKQVSEKQEMANTGNKAALIKKPKPLKPSQITSDDPLTALDQMIVQQRVLLLPYVPFVQAIGILIDYGKVAMKLRSPKEHRYEGGVSILFRKNVQLVGTFGYCRLPPQYSTGKKYKYTVEGKYGCLGLSYFTKYDLRNNLYAGLHYGRSWLSCATYFERSIGNTSRQPLTASWGALAIGSEHQLFKNFGFYAGFVVQLNGLIHAAPFKPATNYIIPGYGRASAALSPSISLYIKYVIPFLEKQISFN